eukprot:scaffold2601_cov117-Isochrysis_galbana.AAC.5
MPHSLPEVRGCRPHNHYSETACPLSCETTCFQQLVAVAVCHRAHHPPPFPGEAATPSYRRSAKSGQSL